MTTPDPAVVPLALYVHWPWCVRKCPYCDFNSHAVRDSLPEDAYVDALLRDLALACADLVPRPLASIFFGGGTPSLFGGASFARVLDAIAERLPLAPECEITVEANPGAAEGGRFRDYRAAGVNRLSLGVQSLRDAQLARLGRIHVAAEARHAYDLARGAGFDNVNVDLMYALPQDDVAGAMRDLEGAIALGPEHLSWYQLTVEPDTAFHREPPPLPDEDTVIDIEEAGHARLAAAGYARYEVSAWARAGRACRHNLNYWAFGDYLGIGAGAHGKVTGAAGILRTRRLRDPRRYLAAAGTPAVVVAEPVAGGERVVFEYLLNALRLREGFALAGFVACTGLPAQAVLDALAQATARGWIEREGERVLASATGYRYLNDVLQTVLPGPADPGAAARGAADTAGAGRDFHA